MRIRKCKYCRASIAGRQDKKYCDRHCRSAFHNEKTKDELCYVRAINNLLRKNRAILKTLVNNGMSLVREETLKERGFDFQHYTKAVANSNKYKQYYCYELSYVEEESGMYALSNKSANL